MLNVAQGFVYNKFQKPNDWPKIEDTFDYKYGNGKLIGGNKNLYLSGPVTYEEVGNPVIKDCIASGFSTNNYLRTQVQAPTPDIGQYIFNIKFKTGNSVTTSEAYQGLLKYTTNNGNIDSGIRISRIGTLSWFIGRKTSSSYEQTSIGGTEVLLTNTWYWAKSYIENNIAYLDLSTDGVNYTTIASGTFVSGIEVSSTMIEIGRTAAWTSVAFNGSIDLNETYIKVNGHLWFYGKNYTTSNVIPVPAGLEYNNTTAPSNGWVYTNSDLVKGLVNYTVVGSPTIVDGIASGFSSGNYVKPASIVPFSRSSSWEFVSRFQVEDNTTGSHFLADFAAEARGFDISVTSTSIFWELGTIAGAWQYSKGISYTFDPTIFYSVKLSFDGNLYSLWLKTDTTQWTKLDEYASTTSVGTSYYNAFGYSIRLGGRELKGSIDLNQTYIKVNGQPWFGSVSRFQEFIPAPEEAQIGKDDTNNLVVETPIVNGELLSPKLVGPIGYTVVGNPTIIDGIASGFSSSDYLTIPSSFSILNNININIKGTYNTTGNAQRLCTGTNFFIYFNISDSFMQVRFTDDNIVSAYVPLNDGDNFETNVTINNSKLKIQLKNLTTGGQHTSSEVIISNDVIVSNLGLGLGIDASSFWHGSIDLNNTYIKVNGKLWFGKEDWTPSTYTDNAIYLLGSHSTDYSSYNTLEFTPTVSDNANYDVWIDNQKLFENENGGTSINWQNLGLTTGYSITTPSTLKAHTIKIVPTNSAKNIIAYKGYIEKAKRVFLQCKASGDYVQANNLFNLTNASTWEIQFKLNTGSNPADRYPIGSSIHTYFPDFSFHTVNYTRVLVPTTEGGSWYEVKVGSVFQTNTDYFVKYGYNNGSYWCQYSTNDGETWTDNFVPFTGPACASSAYMRVGADAWDLSYYFNGVIELSAIKVYADNVLVFDGADSTQYTVYGNPTITEE